MSRFEKFQKSYNESISSIERMLDSTDKPELAALAQWMMTTDANSYAYLPHNWAGHMSSAEGFASLLHCIHHALYDDGDIAFVTVNNEPRIVFVSPHEDNFRDYVLTDQEKEIEKRPIFGATRSYDIQVLDIKADQFGPLYDEYWEQDLQRCFSMDVARFGAEYASEHYIRYKCFSDKWVDICKDQISKWSKFYKR